MQSMVNQDWINYNQIKYFNLMDFISKIKLDKNVLIRAEETSQNFENYIKTLVQFCDRDDYIILYYLLDSANLELKHSAQIENHLFKNVDLFKGNLFFDKLSISHERIKNIHKFVCENTGVNTSLVGEYRKCLVDVGADYDFGHQVYWYAPEAEDVKKFMDDYITFYRTNSLKEIFNNPFLKSALAHLLFVRIHPFNDGNGRTARIIQNITFTSGINKIYDTNLKLSPLNISQNIVINKYTYADKINRIHFDLDYDNESAINNWFKFILNMYDEQLFFQMQRIPTYEEAFKQIQSMKDDNDNITEIAKKFKIEKMKKM